MVNQDIESIGDSKSVHPKVDSDNSTAEVVEGVLVTVTNEEVCLPELFPGLAANPNSSERENQEKDR